MRTLRLTHGSDGDGHRIEIALEGDGPRQTATARFRYAFDPQDQEDLRWYLEDYPQVSGDEVAVGLANRVERLLATIGTQLFAGVFEASVDARDLWARLRASLADTRIEVVTDVEGATAVPWELVRDPRTDAPLALRARSFVRSHPQAAQAPRLPERATAAIRVLLVICRPGVVDVPFRSVAAHLVRLGVTAGTALDLDVLRPPTFADLVRFLESAKRAGNPYQIVHFDGHGIHLDLGIEDELSRVLNRPVPLSTVSLLSPRQAGAHGYLLFEDPTVEANLQLVDGPALGRLLAETDVAVLVLNACRSAHAQPLVTPAATQDDPHGQVRAYGSVAQQVIDAGIAGVVAMRYNVYVGTAAQYLRELYAALLQGQELGAAAALGRKQLAAQPVRDLGEPVMVQDWAVPVVYEAAPFPLVAQPTDTGRLVVVVKPDGGAPVRGDLESRLPPPADVGFVGRDQTLLALDRAFDTQPIVLLHGERGSGTTTTAVEFTRWYARTGGVQAVLFTAFAQHTPLGRVLDHLGEAFRQTLEAQGIDWPALTAPQRRSIALQILRQVPTLWLWDGVGSVPDRIGTPSAWTPAEQQDLLGFLRAARETRARFLLTSWQDEGSWLGELPARIALPPLSISDSMLLARVVAAKRGKRLTDLGNWNQLLTATGGNPKSIIETVSTAVRPQSG